MALDAGAEAARREQQERASSALGELLLRGYRMLGQCCPQCGTILLQDKQQQLLCVTCRETGGGTEGGEPAPDPPARPERCEGSAAALRVPPPEAAAPGAEAAAPGAEAAALAAARAALLGKLRWAALELERSGSVDGSARLCALIRACAEALGALRALGPPAGTP